MQITSENNTPLRWEMVPYTSGEGIQVNANGEKYFPQFLGVGAGKLQLFASQAFDFAVVDDMTDADLASIWRLVKPGGHLVEIVKPDPGGPMLTPPAKFSLAHRYEAEDGAAMAVFQKPANGTPPATEKPVVEQKTACVVRFGAVGDMIQTSSVLACLRDQGYHTTLMCHTGISYEVMANDPNVDAFITQDPNQVPNEWLGPYWTHWMGKFDKFINLSGSVESTWLAIEHRYQFYWPQPVRHHYLNENYLEFMHRLAGMPLKYRPRYYPSSKEIVWAKKQKKKLGGKVILWSLSGSSVHKSWPYMDALIARILVTYPEHKIVTVGDELCQGLELGWENEPRVVKKSGKWRYTESLAFATVAADLVVGPETGILNAVSFLDTPKIVFLSHSSENNLSRDWANCVSLAPKKSDCPCYPCHILHAKGFAWCNRHEETGAALCQAMITVDDAWAAVNYQLRGQ
jgi:ADP-heptose:LPS heptosyltransferase